VGPTTILLVFPATVDLKCAPDDDDDEEGCWAADTPIGIEEPVGVADDWAEVGSILEAPLQAENERAAVSGSGVASFSWWWSCRAVVLVVVLAILVAADRAVVLRPPAEWRTNRKRREDVDAMAKSKVEKESLFAWERQKD
jgi:hypothetical protein